MPTYISAPWLRLLRHYVATGSEDSLTAAVQECSDPTLRCVLMDLRDGRWQQTTEALMASATRYREMSKEMEFGILFLTMLDSVVVHLEPGCDEFVSGCNMGLQLSLRLGYTECAARFCLSLGIYMVQDDRPEDASPLLTQAVEGFRSATAQESGVFELQLASALISCAEVHNHSRKFGESERLLQEAVAMLASRTDRQSQMMLATALVGLAECAKGQGDARVALQMLDRALPALRAAGVHVRDGNRHLAAALSNRGNLQLELGNYPDAIASFREAVEHLQAGHRESDERSSQELASVLNNMSNAYQEVRRFGDARAALEESVNISRSLLQKDPAHSGRRRHLARALTNLASLEHAEKDLAGAEQHLRESIAVMRAERPGVAERTILAESLISLAAVVRAQGGLAEALEIIDEGVSLCQAFDGTHGGPDLIKALMNRGVISQSLGNTVGAYESFVEAASLSNKALAKRERGALDLLVGILNNLVALYEDMGDRQRALDVAREAVERVETAAIDTDELWLLKGKIATAYRHLLRRSIAELSGEDALPNFFALRTPGGRSILPEKQYESGYRALGELSRRQSATVSILYAQVISEGESALLLMQPKGVVWCGLVTRFHAAARDLYDDIVSVFDVGRDSRDAFVLRDTIASTAASAWKFLPDPVKAALLPSEHTDVLICGDATWTRFVWEALRFGDAKTDYLGLHRSLARLGAVTESTLSEFGSRDLFGNGGNSAVVIAPWDALPHAKLPGARDEAKSVAGRLSSAGIRLIPRGAMLDGQSATASALTQALSMGCDLLHFCGHGEIVRNEECLILPTGLYDRSWEYFGSRDLRFAISGRPAGKSAPKVVVLNSCYMGDTRDFGGQREDLVGSFITLGSEVVIASALPVFDRVGALLSEAMYSSCIPVRELGRRIVLVRRLIERATRNMSSWPTWSMISYHGNPFARGIPLPERDVQNDRMRLADLLSLDPQEISATLAASVIADSH